MKIVINYINRFEDQIGRFITKDNKKILTSISLIQLNVLRNIKITFKQFICILETWWLHSIVCDDVRYMYVIKAIINIIDIHFR